MPWLKYHFILETWPRSTPTAYYQYRRSETRLQMMIADNLNHGHYEAFLAFVGSKFRSAIDNKRYANYLARTITDIGAGKNVADAFCGMYGTKEKARHLIHQQALKEVTANSSGLISDPLDALIARSNATDRLEQAQPRSTRASFWCAPLLESSARFDPVAFYDDLTLMKHIINAHPEQCGDILRAGYASYKPIVLSAVSANPDCYICVALQLQNDPDVCVAAHREKKKNEDPLEWLKEQLRIQGIIGDELGAEDEIK